VSSVLHGREVGEIAASASPGAGSWPAVWRDGMGGMGGIRGWGRWGRSRVWLDMSSDRQPSIIVGSIRQPTLCNVDQ
jgi:hypothetical protein